MRPANGGATPCGVLAGCFGSADDGILPLLLNWGMLPMKTRTGGGIAFALGGLGGLNAHGVGFLEAARALNVEPSIISCTGGMITWVADWIEGKPLQPRLEEHLRLGTPFAPPFHWMNTLWIAAFGDPASFRPAIWEYWRRWMKPMDWPDAHSFMDRLWPAQVLVPHRSSDELNHTARVINASAIPVVFNSFQPASSREYLHINRAAAEFLGVETGEIGGASKYLPVDERVRLRELFDGRVYAFRYK